MATNDIGVKIKIDGEAQYREQLRQITQQTKLMKAETAAMENAWTKSTSAQQKATQQLTHLNSQLDRQTEIFNMASANADKYSKELGENASETLKWKAAAKEAEAEMRRLESELAKVPNKVQLMGQAWQQAGERIQNTGRSMTTLGSTLTRTVTVPLTAAVAAAVKTTADFDSSMSKVKAVSGATGAEFEALRTKAREMGAATKFSATEAADAFNYMAMAGWKTSDMMSGIDGIMDLAAASGEDLATASDIVTDSLTAFGESADQSGRLADIMAAACSNANTNVSMMGQTFKKVAPVAGALGYSMEDISLAVGLMANAGIKAEAAGTALRRGFTNMVKPTKAVAEAMEQYDISITNSDGTMKDLRSVIEQLRERFAGLSESEQASAAATIFGTNAYSAWLAIINGSEADYEKLANAIDNSAGTAKRMAETMQDNLAGQLTILKSQLQELAISFGDILVPKIREGVTWIQKQVDTFNKLDEKTKEQILKYGLMAAAIGPVVLAAGKFVTAIGSIVKFGGKAVESLGSLVKKAAEMSPAFSSATSAVSGYAAALAPVVGASAGLLAGSFALGAGVNKLAHEYLETDTALAGYDKTLASAANNTEQARRKFEDAGQAVQSAVEGYDQSMKEMEAQTMVVNGLASELAALNQKQSLTADESLRMQSVMNQLNAVYPELGLQIDAQTGKLNKGSGEIQKYIKSMQEMTQAQIQQEAYAKINQEIVDAMVARVDAELELKELEESVSKATAEHANSDALLGTAQADVAKQIDATRATLKQYDQQIERGNKKLAELDKANGNLATSAGAAGAAVDAEGKSIDEVGTAALEAAGEVETASEEIAKAYQKEYESAYQNIMGQTGLFDKLAEEEKTSIDDMIANLDAHIAAQRAWNENATFLMQTQEYQTDTSFRAMVNSVVSAGDKMAPELAAITNAYQTESDKVSALTQKYGDMDQLASKTAQVTADAAVAAEYGLSEISNAYSDGYGYIVDDISGLESEMSSASGSAAEAGAEAFKRPLESLQNETQGIGAQTVNNFASGMNSISSYVGAVASNVAESGSAPLRSAKDHTWTWGYHMGQNFANGLSSSQYYVSMAAQSLADAAAAKLKHSVPKEGPLKDDDVWGLHLAQNLANGMLQGVGAVESAGDALGGAIETGFKDRLEIHSPSKTMEQAGKEAMQGVIKGVKESSGAAEKSAEEISKLYLQAAEKHLKMQQVMNRTSTAYEMEYWREMYTVAKTGTEGWYQAVINFYTAKNKLAEENAKGEKEAAQATIQYYERNIKLQELTHTMYPKKEADMWKTILGTMKKGTDEYYQVQVNYYTALNEAREAENKKASEAAKKRANEANELAQKQKAAYKEERDAANELTKDYIQSAGELRQAYQEAYLARKDALLGSTGGLWGEVKSNEVNGNPVRTLLDQVNAMRKYNAEVEKLRKRLGNTALFNELNTGDVADTARIAAINNMTNAQLKAYKELYAERTKLAEAQAKRDTAEQKASTEKQVKELTANYKAAIKQANKEIKAEGLTTGQALVSGINLGIKNSMGSLKASFTKEAKDLVRTVRDALGIKSPSKVFADEVGAMIPPGITMGIEKAMPKTVEAMNSEMRKLVTISDRQMVNPDLISGRGGFMLGLDAGAIYEAVKAGTEAAETSVVIGTREFARILRGMGVAIA